MFCRHIIEHLLIPILLFSFHILEPINFLFLGTGRFSYTLRKHGGPKSPASSAMWKAQPGLEVVFGSTLERKQRNRGCCFEEKSGMHLCETSFLKPLQEPALVIIAVFQTTLGKLRKGMVEAWRHTTNKNQREALTLFLLNWGEGTLCAIFSPGTVPLQLLLRN